MKIKSLFIISFLVLIILFSAGFVKAKTVDNSALIAQLKAEIAELSLQLDQLQSQQIIVPATSTWCYTFTNNLKIGDSGDQVKALQTALSKEGLFSGPVTGKFWEKTDLAVKNFQEKYTSDILTPNKLTKGTGYIGLSTRTKLNNLYACWTNNSTIPNPPSVACTPNWTCGWGTCINNSQLQVAVDSNNCGLPSSSTNIACPALARVCTFIAY